MAVSERFVGALRKLSGAFVRHDETGRSVDNLPELAERRAGLEDARAEMQDVRGRDGIRIAERRSAKWVDPRFGLGSTSWIGKAGALIAGGLLFAFLIITAVWILGHRGSSVLAVQNITETLTQEGDGSCSWSVQFDIQNVSTGPVFLRSVRAHIMNEGSRFNFHLDADKSGTTHLELDPDGSTFGQIRWVADKCEPAEGVRHDPIVVTYWDDDTRRDKTATFKF